MGLPRGMTFQPGDRVRGASFILMHLGDPRCFCLFVGVLTPSCIFGVCSSDVVVPCVRVRWKMELCSGRIWQMGSVAMWGRPVVRHASRTSSSDYVAVCSAFRCPPCRTCGSGHRVCTGTPAYHRQAGSLGGLQVTRTGVVQICIAPG
jgi:hypothetical protein